MKRIDIYRTAKLLIQQEGENAQAEALGKMSMFHNQGDFEGALIWTNIAKAIQELEEIELSQSTTIH